MHEHAPESTEGADEFARAYPELAAALDTALHGNLHPFRIPQIAEGLRNAVTGAALATLGVALVVVTGAVAAWLLFPALFAIVAAIDAVSVVRMASAARRRRRHLAQP
jgi:Flp pilus assembly protein TadB